MGRTLAIHWAVTTHGTWLHGDPRGSWRGGRLIGPEPDLEADARACMSGSAVKLSESEKQLVAAAFGEVVHEHDYRVFAAKIQATHVHLVCAPLPHGIKTVIARLKRRSSMAVLERRRLDSSAVPAERISRNPRWRRSFARRPGWRCQSLRRPGWPGNIRSTFIVDGGAVSRVHL